MSVRLTETGMSNYQKVLETVYQYINLLKQKLPSHVFEEQRHIEETKYIFKEQVDFSFILSLIIFIS